MFIVLFYLIIILFENRPATMIDFYITPVGVKFGGNFRYFREFSHFYMIYQEYGIKNLYLEFRNPLLGRMVVPLDGQDALAIRLLLLKNLREDLDREAEPVAEQLIAC